MKSLNVSPAVVVAVVPRVNGDGEEFYTLLISQVKEELNTKGELTFKERHTTVVTNFKSKAEAEAAMLGKILTGNVERVECEEYDYAGGKYSHRWEYQRVA